MGLRCFGWGSGAAAAALTPSRIACECECGDGGGRDADDGVALDGLAVDEEHGLRHPRWRRLNERVVMVPPVRGSCGLKPAEKPRHGGRWHWVNGWGR